MFNKKHSLKIIIVLLIAGMVLGYIFFSKKTKTDILRSDNASTKTAAGDIDKIMAALEETITIRLSFPLNEKLRIEERKIRIKTAKMSLVQTVVEEFLKGPSNIKDSGMPKDTKLLGIYKGEDGILYIDLSDDVRRNFGGDAISEFLLLKGFYESIMSNVPDIADIKLVVEGREMETLGGHIYIIYPLKETVAQDIGGLR
ncbi:MAG: GerMN domain-containing protein [Nitrospiraceae bacterium]|nr:GerMN domain-containing protein [Nitrospiraceae bacterium]